MKTKVILNPYANRWKAKERIPEVHSAMQAAGIEYDLVVTEGPRHAIQLAEQAARQGFDALVAAGGDGTISEVVNGMARARLSGGEERLDLPLGVLPLGSANDFSVNLHLPLDLKAAAKDFVSGKLRWIDLGVVSYRKPGSPPTGDSPFCYFDNNSAIGLEPTITLIQQTITWLHGTPRYLLATLIGIFRHAHWDAELEWEGGSYKGPVTLVTVGNNPLTGGLFFMTPHADPGDGRLTFVHAYMSTRLKVLTLLPRTMKPGEGSYVEHPAVHEIHSPWLRIRCKQPTPLHADGEIQHEAVHEIEYSILPGRLGILG
jgi:diacylglycerol kinase (ATP)